MVPNGLFILFLSFIPRSSGDSFSCIGRAAGYYADVATDCQQYHVCTGGRLQYTHSCPNTTKFQQRMMICDHDWKVDCSRSELDFSANLLLGKRGVPFVSADEFLAKGNTKKQTTIHGSNNFQFKTTSKSNFFSTTQKPVAFFYHKKIDPSTIKFVQPYSTTSYLKWVTPKATPQIRRKDSSTFQITSSEVQQISPKLTTSVIPNVSPTFSAPFSNPSQFSQTFAVPENTPRGFSLKNSQETSFSTPSLEDLSNNFDPDQNLQRLRSLKEGDARVLKLEWTLPDVKAMLYIPDDPAATVLPNIKRYSVTIPQSRMNFKDGKHLSSGSCPENCDPRFYIPGSCLPCVMVK